MSIRIDLVRESVNTLRTVYERNKDHDERIHVYIGDVAHLGLMLAEELLELKTEIAAIRDSLGKEGENEQAE